MARRIVESITGALLALVLGGLCACGDAASSAAPAPAATLPAERVRAVVDEYLRAFNTRNVALYVSLFAPDGTVEDPVGSAPVSGSAALTAFFEAATASGTLRLEVDPALVLPSGNHVAFAFRLLVGREEQHLELRVIDTFELDADGRIVAMRAYWDPSGFRPVAAR